MADGSLFAEPAIQSPQFGHFPGIIVLLQNGLRWPKPSRESESILKPVSRRSALRSCRLAGEKRVLHLPTYSMSQRTGPWPGGGDKAVMPRGRLLNLLL